MQFKNLKDCLAYFSDEKTCWDYIEMMEWKGKPKCPHCGSERVYRLANYKQFKCGNKKTCDKKFTVLTKTIYQNTRIDLSIWMGAIYLACNHKKGISSHQLGRDLGITQRCAWHIIHRLRHKVAKENNGKVKTPVSVDETYVKGAAANRTKKQKSLIAEGLRKDEPTIVLGLVEKGGNAVMKVVPNAESDTLEPVINHHADDSEAILVTDAHHSYQSIGQKYKQHVIVNHSEGQYVKDGYSTNNAEGAFSWFKREIFGTYHSISPKHCQRYCDMFVFRYNTRKLTDKLRFDTVMGMKSTRLRFEDLTQRERNKKDVPL
jgi:transposase-like protein